MLSTSLRPSILRTKEEGRMEGDMQGTGLGQGEGEEEGGISLLDRQTGMGLARRDMG